MIKVTRLNDQTLVINADLIEFVEAIPETTISLTTGKRIMVKESIDDVIERVAGFKRQSYLPGTAPEGRGSDDGR